jgi:splicing factor 3B subunit 2
MEASEEADLKKKEVNGDDSDADENEEGGPLSKKKLKKVSRLSVAELKQLVDKPDVVEVRRYVSSTPVPHLFDL